MTRDYILGVIAYASGKYDPYVIHSDDWWAGYLDAMMVCG